MSLVTCNILCKTLPSSSNWPVHYFHAQDPIMSFTPPKLLWLLLLSIISQLLATNCARRCCCTTSAMLPLLYTKHNHGNHSAQLALPFFWRYCHFSPQIYCVRGSRCTTAYLQLKLICWPLLLPPFSPPPPPVFLSLYFLLWYTMTGC